MSIKTVLHSLQTTCARRGITVGRSHLYEALAAAFGYHSYAALTDASVLDDGVPTEERAARAMCEQARRRLLGLGHEQTASAAVAEQLRHVIHAQGLHERPWEALLDALHPSMTEGLGWEIADELFDDDGDVRDFLRAGLHAAAERGNAKAHYVLALLLRDEDEEPGSAHWHGRLKAGEALLGAPLDWAHAHEKHLQREQARRHHLLEAARLGHPDARVDAAEEFEDATHLLIQKGVPLRDPLRAAEVAASLGDVGRLEEWTRDAALRGDIGAIRTMIQSFDRPDLHRCWVWVYLARELGTDLTQDRYSLVNDDGSDYDDDVGGPAFPVGEDGVSLPSLSSEGDRSAREEAAGLLMHVRGC